MAKKNLIEYVLETQRAAEMYNFEKFIEHLAVNYDHMTDKERDKMAALFIGEVLKKYIPKFKGCTYHTFPSPTYRGGNGFKSSISRNAAHKRWRDRRVKKV
jgi:hypothetical protein